MDTEKYKELIASSKKLQRENEEMSEKMLYLEAELRLVTNKKIYSDEEVRSEQEIKANLSHLKDEWE